ncbi:MAG TPA: aminoacyl-tRNA hydrolase [Dehalococcoidales bacterium]|nr:aminoacyl-tRNA hydrolase [Dehalococcoidales bacterium]
MKLIVGLGNPGREYSASRHNIGFQCINHLAKTHRMEMDKKQGKARVGSGSIAGFGVVLAKPQTYMNLSGESVALLMQKYAVPFEDLIVIHDDLDLPLGKIRIRPDSRAGGHNGVKSIIEALGTQNFIRIRVGISRPQGQNETGLDPMRDYVLGDFTEEDKPVIDETIKRVAEAVVVLLTSGLNPAMNRFNSEPRPPRVPRPPVGEKDKTGRTSDTGPDSAPAL